MNQLERKTKMLWLIRETIKNDKISDEQKVEIIKFNIEVAEEHGLDIYF